MANIGLRLQSWQKARILANEIYDLSTDGKFSKDYELRNQIHRAAGSAMHNIVEGFDAGTNPEFIRFLRMARRSASEVQSQLYHPLDRHYITADELRKSLRPSHRSKETYQRHDRLPTKTLTKNYETKQLRT